MMGIIIFFHQVIIPENYYSDLRNCILGLSEIIENEKNERYSFDGVYAREKLAQEYNKT